MTRVPILTEAVLRAWGTDDPRVLPPLRAENQAGHYRRTKAIGTRAATVGWPPESSTIKTARDKQIRALRRLERMDWSHKGRRDAGLRHQTIAAIPDWGDDETTVSIFDE